MTDSNTKLETESKLAAEVAILTHELKHQRRMWTKFIGGLATGVGTVIGATLIAGALLVIIYPILHSIGFPTPGYPSAATSTSPAPSSSTTSTVS